MMPVRMLWTPYPYRGAFAIMDDTDGATLASVRSVYELLASLGIRTTKTVWAFEPDEPSGVPPLPASILRGVTLASPPYRDYCRELAARGVEIALHGASAGNNRRERTLAAFELLAREFGASAGTYACHAKNAENPYWQQKVVATGPLRALLNVLAFGYRCSGEEPRSRYYWGDVCRERVRAMRLFRTAAINTLAANPSMPYFEREKPYVRGWFAATERDLAQCTSPEALALLAHENGLCLTRQNLARFARGGGASVDAGFERAMRRLRAAPALWVDTAGAVLDRLRLLQGIVLAYRDSNLWIVNTHDEPVRRLQLVMGDRPRPQGLHIDIAYDDGIAVIELLPPRSVTYLDCSAPLFIADRNAVELDAEMHGGWAFGHGMCWLNFGHAPWNIAGRGLAASTFELRFEPGAAEVHALSRAAEAELTRLFLGHAALLVRRIAREGDSPDLGPGPDRPHMELVEN